MMQQTAPVLQLRGIEQRYGVGDAAVHALRGIDLTVHAGEYVAIIGPSGSGKSTLMNVLGCLDVASGGTYALNGHDVASLTEDALARVRGRQIGFVFQSFNLIPRMNAVENVALPLTYAGVPQSERRERAIAALQRVGLGERLDHRPQQLSGGQQQRVAIARALVTEPALILADEPTGNLDNAATEEVLRIFDDVSAEGRTIVVITHEDAVAERAARTVTMNDGRVVADRAARAA